MLNLLDVTLRDGGYVNGFSFSIDEARGITQLLCAAEIPFIEIGYFIPGRTTPDELGRSGYSLQYIEEVSACCRPKSSTVVMVPPGAVTARDYLALFQAGTKIVRFPASPAHIARLKQEIDSAHEAGLKTAVNLTRVSELTLEGLLDVASQVALLGPDWLYLADSNGALFPHQVAQIFRALKARIDRPLGFHAHNGLGLAFANSLAAISEGVALIDASLGGMGKSGGNLSLEVMALHLNSIHPSAFDLKPMFRASEKYLMPWLGETWPKRLKEMLSAIANLNHQSLHAIIQESNGDSWDLVYRLLRRVGESKKIQPASHDLISAVHSVAQ